VTQTRAARHIRASPHRRGKTADGGTDLVVIHDGIPPGVSAHAALVESF
jgi:hypothetical protein